MSRPDPFSLKTALLSLLASAWLMTAGEAATFPANQCAADRFGSNLNCTANDVSLTNIRVVGDRRSCVGGETITLDLEATANFGNANRYDFGIFIANDGKNPRILSTDPSGDGAASCSVDSLPTTSPFLDLDSDACGDGGSAVGGSTGSGVIYMTNVELPCRTTPTAGGKLTISYVASWYQNDGEVCNSSLNVVPGTSSKCSQQDEASELVEVVVLPTITIDDGVEFVASGDATDYTIVIQNLTGATLADVLFKDPAVAGLDANTMICAATGGATCPAATLAELQGGGITLPAMPHGGTLTFTINATLSGNHNDAIINTASVTAGGQSGYASDIDTIIVGDIALSPATSSKSGAQSQQVTHTFTLYNFGAAPADVSLTASSSQGWFVNLSPTSITVNADGSASVTVTVTIPLLAAIGEVDTTTITAQTATDTVTATAVTTVSERLTFTPNHTGAGGMGASVYYNHRVQNNWSLAQSVTFSSLFSGTCTGWAAGRYEADKVTPLADPITLTPLGGYRDVVVKVTVPADAAVDDTCVVTTTASGYLLLPFIVLASAEVVDTTTVKSLVLYRDPGRTEESYIYPAGNEVYGKSFGLTEDNYYFFVWKDPAGNVLRTSPQTKALADGQFPDTFAIPSAGPLGKWTVDVLECTGSGNNRCNTTQNFSYADFYVGPDHLAADYSGANPVINSDVVIDLALHDKLNHLVPLDGSGNLVRGDPSDTEGPLMITVTVSGSASIVSTTLTGAVITGQSVTGKLDSTSGTATLTIRDTVAESVTITPTSYKGVLYGSPVRDEPVVVTFTAPPLDHIRLLHSGSGLTCTPSAVTVQACANADCSSLYADSVSVTLSPGGWVGGDTVSFSGSASYELWHTTAETVTIGATSTPAASNATRCFIGATESCTHTFADTGFIFTVPTLTANKTSAPLTISAVKTSDSGVACTPAFSGARSVSFWSSYANPVSGTKQVSVNGTAVGTAGPGTALSLTFDANAQAEITVHYADAGLLQLDASYAGSGDDAGLVLTGNSQFVVKPVGYCVMSPDANADCASGDATCSAFVAAGADFNLTVSAMAWESDVDSDLCTGNAITPNFQLSGIPLVHSLVAPAGGAGGTLGVSTIDISSNGTATLATQSISEVGVFTITAQGSNYLGVTTTPTTSANIGRFYPDAFTLTITDHGTFAAGCPTCTTPFTYLGDRFGYDSGDLPQVTISAVNLAGDITLNYRGDFAKLATDPAAAITFGYPTADSTTDNADASGKLGVSSAPGTPTISANGDGTLTLQLGASTMDGFTYDRELVPPFTAALSIVLSSVADGDVSTSFSAANIFTPVGVEQRYGRAVVGSTFGSSVAGTTIAIPLTLQYLDAASAFVTNSDDTVTTIDAAYLGCNDPNTGDSLACLTVSGTPGNGGAYTLTADGNRGTLYYLLDLSGAGADLEFLQFDWDENATEDNPQATVVLGIYPNYHSDGRFRDWMEDK